MKITRTNYKKLQEVSKVVGIHVGDGVGQVLNVEVPPKWRAFQAEVRANQRKHGGIIEFEE